MAKFDDTLWFKNVLSVAAGTTTEIFGAVPARRLRVNITGAGASITSFGSVGNATDKMWRFVTWAGINTIVNGGRIATRTGANIVTAANDMSMIKGDGSGNFFVWHFRATNGGSVYTPTLFGITNVQAFTAYPLHVIRADDIGRVSGRVDIDATATGNTLLDISLPFTSDLVGAGSDLSGKGVNSNYNVCRIFGNVTDNRASLQFNCTDASGPFAWDIDFSFQVH